MRILSGIYRGQRLLFPEHDVLRPTQEKVRAAVFNILQKDIMECRFLDLCCGTGSMGIEALSRGAKYVHFVDLNTTLLTENIARLKPTPEDSQWKVTAASSTRFLSTLRPDSFDVIFFDPPWKETDLYAEALAMIAKTKCLSETGTLFIEHHRDQNPTPYPLPGGGKKSFKGLAPFGSQEDASEDDDDEGFGVTPAASPKKEKTGTPPPSFRSRRKSNKYRLSRREIEEAQGQEIKGTYRDISKKIHYTDVPDPEAGGIFGIDDSEGQWSPSAKQAPRQPEYTYQKKKADLEAAIVTIDPKRFPLVVSHVYEYSDTHLTRMEYPRA